MGKSHVSSGLHNFQGIGMVPGAVLGRGGGQLAVVPQYRTGLVKFNPVAPREADL